MSVLSRFTVLLVAAVLGLAMPPSRPGATPLATTNAANPCRVAAAAAERSWNIPPHLLAAIARVETGRAEAGGDRGPWPWSVNEEGVGSMYDSKEAAIAAVRRMQAQGARSIDIGCMQVNLMHHPDAFATLEEAFDPAHNAEYAARFLTTLREQTGSWPAAAGAYHSMTPELGRAYLRQVLQAWPLEALGGGLERIGAGSEGGRPSNLPRNQAQESHAAGPDDAPGGTDKAGPGAMMLSNGAEHAHILAAPPSAPPGRGLDAYRSMPVLMANRPLRAPAANRF